MAVPPPANPLGLAPSAHAQLPAYTEQELEDWLSLVTEVTQAINSKQLVPTMRSQ